MWYGVCKNDTITGHKLYCRYNGTAKPLSTDGQQILKKYCPHLVHGETDTYTCCDAEQVNSFTAIIISPTISSVIRFIAKSHIRCLIFRLQSVIM